MTNSKLSRKGSLNKKSTQIMGDGTPSSSRKRRLTDLSEEGSKRRKAEVTHSSHGSISGMALAFGEGDTGQLGLGEDIMDRSRPAKIPGLPLPGGINLGDTSILPDISVMDTSGVSPLEDGVIQVCSGGMHSVCVTKSGRVFTFGCNDEDALGRPTASEEGSETKPGLVVFPDVGLKIIQVSAGDSHTAALTHEGQVYIWGTFRDSNGVIGLTQPGEKSLLPMKILEDQVVVKIASGTDHLICLTDEGELYTLGCGEQGQLGRVAERFVKGGRKGIDLLLTPAACRLRGRIRFNDVWAGSYVSFARCAATGNIYACGLNNYFQLGSRAMESRFMLQRMPTFDPSRQWTSFAAGQHHTLALDSNGTVYALGRAEYGRLGLGPEATETDVPTPIPTLQDKKCSFVSCGTASSYAIDSEGVLYSWGMGSTKQLGHSDEDDCDTPKKVLGKNLENKMVVMVSGGGQHVLLLVSEANNNLIDA